MKWTHYLIAFNLLIKFGFEIFIIYFKQKKKKRKGRTHYLIEFIDKFWI